MRRSPPMKTVITRTREYFLAAAPPGLLTRSSWEWALFVLVVAVLGVGVFLDWRRDSIRWGSVEGERLERDAGLVSALLGNELRTLSSGLDGLRENRFWQQNVDRHSGDVSRRLEALAGAMDGVRSLLVTDQRGVVIASSQPAMLGADLSGRECFGALRESRDAARHCLSQPFVSPTGLVTFVVSAIIPGPLGQWDGTVIAALEPSWLVQLMRPLQTRADDLRLSLVHVKGAVVHTEPASGPFSGGADPVPTTWWPEVRAAGAGRSFVAVDHGGWERYVAVVPVSFHDDNPLAVVASRDRASVDAAIANNAIELALSLAAVAAAAAVALALYQRRRQIMEQVEHRAESERKRADAMLSKMIEQQVSAQTISAFAHDLNQPLLAISAYSEAALNTLRRGVPDTARLTRMLEGSHTQALRAGSLMHQMSAQLSKALAPQEPPERFDLNELITQTAAEVFEQQPDVAAACFDLAPGPLWVAGFRTRTNRVLQNLLLNACQASRASGLPMPAGHVTVSSRRIDGFAEVGVRDFGPGVSAKDAERIFSPFYTTKQSGLGLGLSISRALAESQGGKLELSEAPGAGTEFSLTLPLAKTHEHDLPR